jgi:hypothetical protein
LHCRGILAFFLLNLHCHGILSFFLLYLHCRGRKGKELSIAEKNAIVA